MPRGMHDYEYKVVAAPTQGRKAKGVKTTPERFALALGDVLNEHAADGWVYVRAETLPCDERRGLTGTQTTFQNMLIFRRAQPILLTQTTEPVEAAKAPEPQGRDLPDHPDADPVSTALGDTLRATRASDEAPVRKLGPANAED